VKTVEKEAKQPLQLQAREWRHGGNKCEMVKYETKTHNTPQIEEKETKRRKKGAKKPHHLPSPPFFDHKTIEIPNRRSTPHSIRPSTI